MRSPLLFLIGILIAAMFCCGFNSDASTTTKRTNTFGAVIPFENPYTYLMGSVLGGEVFQSDSGRVFTNIRFQPSFSYDLYDESVLFCGDVSGQFKGARPPIIVTYEKMAHDSANGIGCHQIRAVNEVVQKGIQ